MNKKGSYSATIGVKEMVKCWRGFFTEVLKSTAFENVAQSWPQICRSLANFEPLSHKKKKSQTVFRFEITNIFTTFCMVFICYLRKSIFDQFPPLAHCEGASSDILPSFGFSLKHFDFQLLWSIFHFLRYHITQSSLLQLDVVFVFLCLFFWSLFVFCLRRWKITRNMDN